jgi:hypothetical protein
MKQQNFGWQMPYSSLQMNAKSKIQYAKDQKTVYRDAWINSLIKLLFKKSFVIYTRVYIYVVSTTKELKNKHNKGMFG